jgi:uncharacterized protein
VSSQFVTKRALTPSPALARIAPFAVFILLLIVESVAGGRAGDLQWLTVLRPFIVAVVLAALWRHYEELHELPRIPWRYWILGIALGLGVFAAWIVLDHGWMVIGTPRGYAPLAKDGRVDVTLALLRAAGFALIVPVMEELFWRSFLLRRIDAQDFLRKDPRTATLAAFALSSALFASEHSFWLAGLVAGAAYNVCFMRSRNLWVSILSHAITNGTLALYVLATHRWHAW